MLAGIIRDPSVLLDDAHPLSPDDFPTRFHAIVFGAVEHLIKDGATSISAAVIDDFLSRYPQQYKVFTSNNGVDYVNALVSALPEGSFEHHYNRLKKVSVLNRLHEQGFDISFYYDPSAPDPSPVRARLDGATPDDILLHYEMELSAIRQQSGADAQHIGGLAGDGLSALKERLKEKPEMGLPMNSKKLATICRGRRLKKLYLRVAPSGLGKTRLSLADACLISIPRFYDPKRKRFVKSDFSYPTLFITTELEKEEVQTMILAYVACVPEEHILDGRYAEGEEARVDKAISIIASSPLWIEHIPQFNIDNIENLIRRYKLEHGIAAVFFDYLFTSTKVLMEIAQKTRGVSLREDNVLMMFSDRMKTLCNRLNVHIDTSTQANGGWKDARDPDQNLIRGSKAIADKVDIGYCVLEPTARDLEAVRSIMEQRGTSFFQTPNLVFHIFKVRRGRLNHVKLFMYFDYSTLRTTDLFVTDRDYKLVDVENTDIETVLDETECPADDPGPAPEPAPEPASAPPAAPSFF